MSYLEVRAKKLLSMAKKKQKQTQNNRPRKFIEFIRKTLFGEKLEKAILRPAIEKPLVVNEVERTDHLTGGEPSITTPEFNKTARIANQEQRESIEFEVRTAARVPLDPSNISRLRVRMKALFAESQSATLPLIHIGIDLGTSSSKVVWRGEQSVNLVCFGSEKLKLDNYLMPSLVGFDGANLLFGYKANGRNVGSRISNFKMCLACVSQKPENCSIKNCTLTKWPIDRFPIEVKDLEVEFVNSYFLANLIVSVKSAIRIELSKTIPGKINPKWTANLAVPETFIEQSSIADAFREVLRTAWFMSEIYADDSELISQNSDFECFQAARSLAIESLMSESSSIPDYAFGCSIYPEVGAEIASLVMSRTTPEGLYAFVDIGAGTIDASLFNYFRGPDGEPNRPPYSAAVSTDLGAAQVEIQASRVSVNGANFSVEDLKAIKERFTDLTEMDQQLLSPQLNAIGSVLANLNPKTQEFLQCVFKEARDSKDPDIVNKPIRLVIGGGGSYLQSFRSASVDAFTLKNSKKPTPPEVTELQVPKDLIFVLPSTEFHRFSVAYGLSFSIDALPKIVFSKDVEKKKGPEKRKKDYGSMYEK